MFLRFALAAPACLLALATFASAREVPVKRQGKHTKISIKNLHIDSMLSVRLHHFRHRLRLLTGYLRSRVRILRGNFWR